MASTLARSAVVTIDAGGSDIDLALLREVFMTETEEGLETMEQALLALEARPNDSELLQTVFRAAHTLKGGAASLGLEGLGDFTHSMEDVLDKLRSKSLSPTREVVTLLLECVDALREMVPAELEAVR
jgi:two-component system, chemotaxis family, sensor kinase CheA